MNNIIHFLKLIFFLSVNAFFFLSYREKSLTQDFSWTSENSLESQIVQNAKNCIYRSEINSLMTQLLGCKCEESENETILLDLCAKNEKET